MSDEIIDVETSLVPVYSTSEMDLDSLFDEQDALVVDPNAMDISLQSSRFPPLSILTSGSKSDLLTKGITVAGTFALGGKLTRRPVTFKPDEPVQFIVAAVKYLRLRVVPSDAEANAGMVLCAGMQVPGKKEFQAVRGSGTTHPDPAMNHIFARISKETVSRKTVLQFTGWEFPEGREETRDCSKCLFGPARCASGSDRGFIRAKEPIWQLVDGKPVQLDAEDVKMTDGDRKPQKTDCSMVTRVFGHVRCPAFDGLPASWVPCHITFRNSGYKASEALRNTLKAWVTGNPPKPVYAHPIILQSVPDTNAGGIAYRRLTFVGPVMRRTNKPGPSAVPGPDGSWQVPMQVLGAKQVQMLLEQKGVYEQDMVTASIELAANLTNDDWIGFVDEEALEYDSEPALTGDAAHMPTDLPY